MILLHACRKITALCFVALFLYLGYLRVLVTYYSHRQYHAPHDRQTPWQVMMDDFDVARRNRNATLEYIHAAYNSPSPLLKGKVVMVTGATKGLGRGVVGHLAALGATLVLHCRRCNVTEFTEQINQDAQEYAVQYGKLPLRSSSSFMQPLAISDVDLADLDQIDTWLAELSSQHIKIDILVSNAGLVSMYPARTKQGFETTMGVNYIAPAYLIVNMRRNGLFAPNARIVSVSSEDHRSAWTIQDMLQATKKPFGAFFGEGLLDALPRYDFSKLLDTTFALALARKWPELSVVDMCPGPTASNIPMVAVWPLNIIVKLLMDTFLFSIDYAGIAVVRMAAADEGLRNKSHGRHYQLWEETVARDDATDERTQDWLWDVTMDLIEKRKAPE